MSHSNPASKGKKQTLIEDETQFKGVFHSECPIVVKGSVDGEVSGPSLHVSESGSVSGTVKVDSLDSQGSLSGTFEAGSVQLSGKVQDETVIRARSLEVKLASEAKGLEVTFGECDLDVGDVPAKEDAVGDALASARKGDGQAPAEDAPVAEAPAAEAKRENASAEQAEGKEAKEKEAEGESADSEGQKRRDRRESTSPAQP